MKILILEDDHNRIATFRDKLGERHELTIVETAEDAISKLKSDIFDVIFLDHDLGGEVYVSTEDKNTGSEVARWMSQAKLNQPYVIIHSLNTPAAASMAVTLKGIDITGCWVIPFTTLVSQHFNDPSFLSEQQ